MQRMNEEKTPDNESEVKLSQALAIVLGYSTEKRTLIQFDRAEKFSKTYRIKANSWNEAKRRIEDEDLSIDNGWTDRDDADYEQDTILCVEDSYCHWEDYKPTFDRKIEQVKIGYRWYDLDRLTASLRYYVSDDHNIRRVMDDNARKAVMIILTGGEE
tara:strand:- start:1132 stop:1605 length:474 start_codon:yes stop_codon:yes gene_type:complete